MSKIGDNVKLEIYGASHSPSIGMRLSGIKSGFSVDIEKLQAFCDRRKSVSAVYSTSRGEPDKLLVLEGIEGGKTTGGDIVVEIKNTTARSADYDDLKYTPRPSHADYAAKMKYGLDIDLSGGGSFSGRMTAPLCIAGGIAEQLLEADGVMVAAYIAEIGGIKAASYLDGDASLEKLKAAKKSNFPLLDEGDKPKLIDAIALAKADGDSLGGVIEAVVLNLPVGLGDCLFDGLEGKIANYIFGIPAVKGLEFGLGFGLTKVLGSEANDSFYYDNGRVKTRTNNSGGINGGISNGMPITLRVAIRPTPSIAKPQNSVNLKDKTNTTIQIKGRHDACIAPRAAVAVEAAVALALIDLKGNENNE